MQTFIAWLAAIVFLLASVIFAAASVKALDSRDASSFLIGVLITIFFLALAYFSAWLGGI
jgi:hypothetical membrane protein